MAVVTLGPSTSICDYPKGMPLPLRERFPKDVYIPLRERFKDYERRIQFEVPTLDLPAASERWVVRWQGHPEVTFEDLRAGRLPKPSAIELIDRQKAIKAAQEIRQKIDISPLTTETLIRQLRDGSEQ